MSSVARDTRLITADSAGSLFSQSLEFSLYRCLIAIQELLSLKDVIKIEICQIR